MEEPGHNYEGSRYCARCGAVLDHEAQFCQACGMTVAETKTPVSFTDPQGEAGPRHEFRWINAIDPSGRFNRLEFLLFVLGPILILAVIGYAIRPLGFIGLVLASIIIVVACIRRFHDLNHSGWFTVLGLIPPVLLGMLAVLAILPGTRGPNRWGV